MTADLKIRLLIFSLKKLPEISNGERKGFEIKEMGKELYLFPSAFCNKLQQTWWLKTTLIYYLTVLEARSETRLTGMRQIVDRAVFLSGGTKGKCSFFVFQAS